MKKELRIAAAVVAAVLMLAGCEVHTNMAYTFSVETGDKVKVELDTTDDYELLQEEGRYKVKHKEDTILQGVFLTKEMYDQYMQGVKASDAKILEEEEKDGNSYMFYEYEGEGGTENNFVVWIKNSDTGLLVGSLAGEKKAKEGFERLSFSVEK